MYRLILSSKTSDVFMNVYVLELILMLELSNITDLVCVFFQGQIECDSETVFELAALVLQVTHGDFTR